MSESNITKNALAEAMKELMQEKKFEKISVTDICEKCGMNRKSFYYHFRDKYDLVNWIFYVGFMDHINPQDYAEEGNQSTGKPFLLAEEALKYFYNERAFYKKALMIEGQNSFLDYFHDAVEPIFQYFLSDVLGGEKYSDFFAMMICDAFVSGLVRWLESEEPEEPSVLFSGIQKMMFRVAKKLTEASEVVENNKNHEDLK